MYSAVVPLVGAWIEIAENATDYQADTVVPLVGAWIEITVVKSTIASLIVVPLVGAWIEITHGDGFRSRASTSFPSWERGLKLVNHKCIFSSAECRSPRGSVD